MAKRPAKFPKQTNLIYFLGAVILVFGLYLIVPDRRTEQAPNNQTTAGRVQEISYQGVEGKNALELLRDSHQVETEKFDFGELVVSIDGVKPDKNQFWAFYVNSAPSQVGASAYQTKASDTITWKLDTIQ